MSKKLYMFVSTFLLCVLLAGCGANMSASPNLGTWEAESASMSGVELAIGDIMPGGFTFILNADGSCELHVNGQTEKGKWKDTEDGFIVEDEITFKTDGDKAVCDYDGVTMNFKRTAKAEGK